MKSKIFILIIVCLIVIVSCSVKEKPGINYSKFKDIKSVEIALFMDTMNILINDDSYIYFRDYDSLKVNFLLWKNKHVLSYEDNIKIRINHQDGGYINSFTINSYEKSVLIESYQKNKKYELVLDYFFTEFNPTEVMNLRNANEFLNNKFRKYDKTYIELLSDLTICEDNCSANNRLKMIIKIVTVTGIDDFWTHEEKDVTEFIEKLKTIQSICGIK